jgi:predicted transcriptional regulator
LSALIIPRDSDFTGGELLATKAEVMKALEDLPEDATIDDAVERLVFMIAVEHGLAQAEAGELIPHGEIVRLVKTWLK